MSQCSAKRRCARPEMSETGMQTCLKHAGQRPDNAKVNIHCASDSSATTFLRNGNKYNIHFIDNLLLFPTVKELSKSVNS